MEPCKISCWSFRKHNPVGSEWCCDTLGFESNYFKVVLTVCKTIYYIALLCLAPYDVMQAGCAGHTAYCTTNSILADRTNHASLHLPMQFMQGPDVQKISHSEFRPRHRLPFLSLKRLFEIAVDSHKLIASHHES